MIGYRTTGEHFIRVHKKQYMEIRLSSSYLYTRTFRRMREHRRPVAILPLAVARALQRSRRLRPAELCRARLRPPEREAKIHVGSASTHTKVINAQRDVYAIAQLVSCCAGTRFGGKPLHTSKHFDS